MVGQEPQLLRGLGAVGKAFVPRVSGPDVCSNCKVLRKEAPAGKRPSLLQKRLGLPRIVIQSNRLRSDAGTYLTEAPATLVKWSAVSQVWASPRSRGCRRLTWSWWSALHSSALMWVPRPGLPWFPGRAAYRSVLLRLSRVQAGQACPEQGGDISSDC